ncbi:hypothetical protein MRX96_028103 [Rhipicephalus microplus]
MLVTAVCVNVISAHVSMVTPHLNNSSQAQPPLGRPPRQASRLRNSACQARQPNARQPNARQEHPVSRQQQFGRQQGLISGMVAGSSSDNTEVEAPEFAQALSAPQQPSNIEDFVTGRRNSPSDSGDGARRKRRKYTGAEMKEKMLNEQRLLREAI